MTAITTKSTLWRIQRRAQVGESARLRMVGETIMKSTKESSHLTLRNGDGRRVLSSFDPRLYSDLVVGHERGNPTRHIIALTFIPYHLRANQYYDCNIFPMYLYMCNI